MPAKLEPARLEPAKPDFAKRGFSDVNNAALPSTLRDLRLHLTRPRVAVVMAGVAIILGLSGPFDTWAVLPLLPRMAYWALVVICTYAAGFVVTTWVQPWVQGQHVAWRTGMTGLAVAVGVYAVLTLINLMFGQVAVTLRLHLLSFGVVLVICLVIEVASQVFGQSAATITTAAATATTTAPLSHALPALLLRLPLEKRGALVSISVQDHYVDVTTTRGHDMLLLRLGDAMREAAPEAGLQVHRSHWVAVAQVVSARRNGDAAVLVMRHGRDVPVSRGYMTAIRDAGLLPRKGA